MTKENKHTPAPWTMRSDGVILSRARKVDDLKQKYRKQAEELIEKFKGGE